MSEQTPRSAAIEILQSLLNQELKDPQFHQVFDSETGYATDINAALFELAGRLDELDTPPNKAIINGARFTHERTISVRLYNGDAWWRIRHELDLHGYDPDPDGVTGDNNQFFLTDQPVSTIHFYAEQNGKEVEGEGERTVVAFAKWFRRTLDKMGIHENWQLSRIIIED